MAPSTIPPYNGAQRKLVLAFDIGTTFSGVSFSILDPGLAPELEAVTRYIGSVNAGGDSKVPTVVYYDSEGGVAAIGGATNVYDIEGKAEEEGWQRVEWFKLHLSPAWLLSGKLPKLPPTKTIVDVFADFMVYLHHCAKVYIEQSRPNGNQFWESFEGRIDYVLTHPNGWEPAQQAQMRRSAIKARLIGDGDREAARLQFVTEGEASLHFCLESGSLREEIKTGSGVLVIDAGGGTIDLSAYHMKSVQPRALEEIAAAECLMQGSVFVSRRAEGFLKQKLDGSPFGSPDDIKDIVTLFDKTAKINFKDPAESSFIKIGRLRDHDSRVGIRSGQFKIAGTDMAALFEPSITDIVSAIHKQMKVSKIKISAVFLVGGFGTSHWLFTRLRTLLEPLDLTFSRPDGQLNKAVANGAISFYLNNIVSTRVARKSYGIIRRVFYDADNAEHRKREAKVLKSYCGCLLDNNWDAIIEKGTQVGSAQRQEYRRTYFHEGPTRNSLGKITIPLRSYLGEESPEPEWVDDSLMFPVICRVVADLSKLSKALQPTKRPDGAEYFKVDFNIQLIFGLTELKAQLIWMEDGEEKKSSAAIVCD